MQTIPAMPVRDAGAAVGFYRDRLGFEMLHHDGGFAVMGRDDAVVHLWEASDESWRERDAIEGPVCSGAESFIAGTASCRIGVDGVDALYAELRGAGRAPPVSQGGVDDDRLRHARVRHARPGRQPRHLLRVGLSVIGSAASAT